jgi:hypothetical protein
MSKFALDREQLEQLFSLAEELEWSDHRDEYYSACPVCGVGNVNGQHWDYCGFSLLHHPEIVELRRQMREEHWPGYQSKSAFKKPE